MRGADSRRVVVPGPGVCRLVCRHRVFHSDGDVHFHGRRVFVARRTCRWQVRRCGAHSNQKEDTLVRHLASAVEHGDQLRSERCAHSYGSDLIRFSWTAHRLGALREARRGHRTVYTVRTKRPKKWTRLCFAFCFDDEGRSKTRDQFLDHSSMSSATRLRLLTSTGVPQPVASIATDPKPSRREGIIIVLARHRRHCRSGQVLELRASPRCRRGECRILSKSACADCLLGRDRASAVSRRPT